MSKDSFDEIYEELFPVIFRFVRVKIPQSDIEDVTAEIITKVWRALPTFQGNSSLKTWALKIAYHYIADYYRIHKNKKLLELSLNEGLKEIRSVDDHSEQISELLSIKNTLAKLTEEQLMAIQLRLVEGFSAHEVATILGISQQAVDSLLYRAKKSFRKLYETEITGGIRR